MAITASDLVRRAVQMKQAGLDAHEIGRRLVDIALANGHTRVQPAGSGSPPEVVMIRLIDTGVTDYFDGQRWGHTLDTGGGPSSRDQLQE